METHKIYHAPIAPVDGRLYVRSFAAFPFVLCNLEKVTTCYYARSFARPLCCALGSKSPLVGTLCTAQRACVCAAAPCVRSGAALEVRVAALYTTPQSLKQKTDTPFESLRYF